MSYLKSKILIILICLLAFLLRIYLLDKIPNSISADEAAFGYNAYSILKTGRDEFGVKYPLFFRSFDDYKNPVYGYLLIPFIKIFGLTEYAIRIPSVISGILVVLLLFLLTKRLTDKIKLSLIVAFLGAISPWLIQYSRVGIEIETSLFLTLLGFWLFLKGKERPLYYLISAVVLAIDFYTYYSAKLWIVLFGPVFLILAGKINKYIFAAIIIFSLMIFPYLKLIGTSSVALRPIAISVFSQEAEKYQSSRDIIFDLTRGLSAGKLLHNRRLVIFNQITEGYLNILGPQHLFSRNQSNQIPATRLFYLWQFPLLIIGFLFFVRFRSTFLLAGYWLFVGFLPGAITIYPPLDRRILLNSFPLLLLVSYGFLRLQMTLIRRIKTYKTIVTVIPIILVTISFYFYTHIYYVHGKETVVELWGNGMKELVNLTSKEKDSYDNIIVSIKLNQPLTFFLFYERYDPAKYLAEGGTISGGYLDENGKFAKYKFMNITPNNLSTRNLYVWDAREEQPCLKAIHTIKRSDTSFLGHIGSFNPGSLECQKWLSKK